jgi:glucokinase
MASSHVSVEENSSSTILAADIGGTNARFQVLFNLVLWITCSHSYKYNADMEL